MELEVIVSADKEVVGNGMSESEMDDNGDGWRNTNPNTNTEENENSFGARSKGVITANTDLVESTRSGPQRDNNNGLHNTMNDDVEEGFETRSQCAVYANIDLVESVAIELESDDNESHDLDPCLKVSTKGPHQPILKSYKRKMYETKPEISIHSTSKSTFGQVLFLLPNASFKDCDWKKKRVKLKSLFCNEKMAASSKLSKKKHLPFV